MKAPTVIPIEVFSKDSQAEIAALKAAGMSVFVLRPSVSCESPTCKASKKTQEELFRCSGCAHIKYCSPSCQKRDWKSHRAVCAAIKDYKELQNNKDPAQEELSMYMSSLSEFIREEVGLAGRSALLLPYKEHSLRDTHFIAIHLNYKAPETPIDTSDTANIIAVRKLFTFQNAEVVADRKAPEVLQTRLKGTRCIDSKQLCYPGAYFALYVATEDAPTECQLYLSGMAPRRVYDEPGDYRLNPKWREFIKGCFERNVYHMDKLEKLSIARMEDLELYETPEFIEESRERFRRCKESWRGHDFSKDLDIDHWNRLWDEEGPAAANEFARSQMKKLGWRLAA